MHVWLLADEGPQIETLPFKSGNLMLQLTGATIFKSPVPPVPSHISNFQGRDPSWSRVHLVPIRELPST